MRLPSHGQLSLPLLETLREAGTLSPGEAADRVAAKLGIGSEVRNHCSPMPGYSKRGVSYAADNGGAIPANFFNVPNSTSNSSYQRYCRQLKLPIHPARFPEREVIDFFVKFLTNPGDMVADFCGGSMLLPEACERLGRRWFSCEKHLPYIRGAESRFSHLAGFQSYGIFGEPRLVLPLA